MLLSRLTGNQQPQHKTAQQFTSKDWMKTAQFSMKNNHANQQYTFAGFDVDRVQFFSRV
jgi:hypothetical protein